jgi:hypothetical protein
MPFSFFRKKNVLSSATVEQLANAIVNAINTHPLCALLRPAHAQLNAEGNMVFPLVAEGKANGFGELYEPSYNNYDTPQKKLEAITRTVYLAIAASTVELQDAIAAAKKNKTIDQKKIMQRLNMAVKNLNSTVLVTIKKHQNLLQSNNLNSQFKTYQSMLQQHILTLTHMSDERNSSTVLNVASEFTSEKTIIDMIKFRCQKTITSFLSLASSNQTNEEYSVECGRAIHDWEREKYPMNGITFTEELKDTSHFRDNIERILRFIRSSAGVNQARATQIMILATQHSFGHMITGCSPVIKHLMTNSLFVDSGEVKTTLHYQDNVLTVSSIVPVKYKDTTFVTKDEYFVGEMTRHVSLQWLSDEDMFPLISEMQLLTRDSIERRAKKHNFSRLMSDVVHHVRKPEVIRTINYEILTEFADDYCHKKQLEFPETSAFYRKVKAKTDQYSGTKSMDLAQDILVIERSVSPEKDDVYVERMSKIAPDISNEKDQEYKLKYQAGSIYGCLSFLDKQNITADLLGVFKYIQTFLNSDVAYDKKSGNFFVQAYVNNESLRDNCTELLKAIQQTQITQSLKDTDVLIWVSLLELCTRHKTAVIHRSRASSISSVDSRDSGVASIG